MRHVLLAALIAVGLSALAGEALEIPAIRMPAPSQTLTVSESLLTGLGVLEGDVKKIQAEVARLNQQRTSLLKTFEDARKDLLAKQKEVSDAMAALDKQQEDLDAFVAARLPADRRDDYTARRRLQPVIDWLGLKDDQVSQLLAKQKTQAKAVADARDAAEAALSALRALKTPETEQEHTDYRKARMAYTAAIKTYSVAAQTWLDNIESVLTDEQKQVWRTRYRRTASPLDLVPPALPGPATNE